MMKRIFNSNIFISLLAICATVITSCNTNEELIEKGTTLSSSFSCEATNKTFGDVSSRSELYFTQSGMEFKWTENDQMTVFARGDNNAAQIYNLRSGGGTKRADFYADNFKLQLNKLYYAISKAEKNPTYQNDYGNSHVIIPSQNNITLYYDGQTQIGNSSAKHLGDYDFMVGGATCTDENNAHFSFYHLGATLRIIMPFTEDAINAITDTYEKDALRASATEANAVRFTEVEIFDSENSFRQTRRNFSFEAGTNQDNTYTTKWPEQTITEMDRFSVKLKKAADSEEGVSRFDAKVGDGLSGEDGMLIAYMEVPPVDFRGKKIGIMLKGYYMQDEVKKEVSYVATVDGKNIEFDKAYMLKPTTMEKPKDFKVNLKINHLWQYGNKAEVSRSTTGDPGYDKEFVAPNYIYYIYCVDSKVKAIQDAVSNSGDLHPYNSIVVNGNDNNKWTLDEENSISTYGKMLTFIIDEADKGKKTQLFVIAANKELDGTFESIIDGVNISKVLALAYDITTSAPQETTQVFLRDLYSTPYESDASFVGNLTDPIQDIFLYHTAAKVDLKWNSTTEMTVGSGSDIKVNNVKHTGLSLFKPTTNTNATGSYTVTTPITDATKVNGRQVYYLPQFSNNTYNVTIGTKNSDVVFTGTNTTGGFTSWLRGLIKQ